VIVVVAVAETLVEISSAIDAATIRIERPARVKTTPRCGP
jgi:hypothetical protein